VEVHDTGTLLVRGLAIGADAAVGPVCVIDDASQIDRFVPDAVLVTRMTDPDWVPIMKKAAAIVTDAGGRTSHAAIVSRELGVPAVIGTGDATSALRDGRVVTVSCAEGAEGFVHEGEARIEREEISLEEVPATRTSVMLNLASPDGAFRWARLPADGVGLARMEFIVNGAIQAHPMALLHPDRVEDKEARARIRELTRGFEDGAAFFVEQLAGGIARIAASRWPDRVIVRMSDFKSNEYAALVGGAVFEPEEENPMLGLRGAARYDHPLYREAFALECRAIRRVREEIGLTNVSIMIPFCRTVDEADRVLGVLADHGLSRGRKGLEVHVMCEVPSNVLLADLFAERFDGFSIGTNDLTQLVLGVDRDSEALAELFDERDEAVQRAIRHVIATVHGAGGHVGLCGQAPSDDPAFARALVEAGIDAVSVSPDSFLRVKANVAAAEAEQRALHHGERRGGAQRER
jgi:pyruvate,water dikinase